MMGTDWMSDGLCSPRFGHSPDTWFPSSEGGRQRREVSRAQSICGGCPVRDKCREYAERNGFGIGVWGGEHRTHRASSTRIVPTHGTSSGYRFHMRHHQMPCEPCRKAHALANAEYQKQRRGA